MRVLSNNVSGSGSGTHLPLPASASASTSLLLILILSNSLMRKLRSLLRKCCMVIHVKWANWQKVDEFEPIYLGNYRYWWKMVWDFWAHYQPFFYGLCSFTPTWRLFFLFCVYFLTFFLFILPLSTCKLLNALYSKFEPLKISTRTSVQIKLGVPGCGDPCQSGPPKFWTFESLELDGSNFGIG